MFDTSVLGAICHPRAFAEIKLWHRGVLGVRRHKVYAPEIADFELLRKLLHISSVHGLRMLDALPLEAVYLPITTAMMRDAAELWAQLRRSGRQVGHDDALGADVILAAQARAVDATVVTDDMEHLGRMVRAVTWRDVA